MVKSLHPYLCAIKFLRYILFPFAMIYGLIIWVRNRLYDRNVLKSVDFDVNIVVIGNISVGGTGKTPMTSYMIDKLSEKYQIAVLSRGYGRKTKGFLEVTTDIDPYKTGDEPWLLKNRHHEIPVVVCENRIMGVIKLMELHPKTNLILMDDGFQHRAITPKVSVILTTFQRPFWKDFLIPVGNLREGKNAIHRGDFLVITKTPPEKSIESPYDIPTFHSTITYQKPKLKQVFGFSGLANNGLFQEFLNENYELLGFEGFSDHYSFTQKDYQNLIKKAGTTPLVCTEKDYVKIKKFDLEQRVIPIQITTRIENETEFFNQLIKKIES